MAAFGATAAFCLNALSYLPILAPLRRWQRVSEVSRLPPEGLGRSISSGLRYIANMQPLRRALLRVFAIDPELARDFYNLMLDVRVSRARMGTYDWSLSRDIADPEIWSERFSCPTWDDYLRLRGRRTLEDSALHLSARNMHMGMDPVRISRWLRRPAGSVRWHEEMPDRGDDGLH